MHKWPGVLGKIITIRIDIKKFEVAVYGWFKPPSR
jgi:hypothetical protein